MIKYILIFALFFTAISTFAQGIEEKPGFKNLNISKDGNSLIFSHDEQRGFGLHAAEDLTQVRAVDVRHEVRAQPVLPIRPKRFSDHGGAEVRATDPDVHHIGDGPARVTDPRTLAYRPGELAHLVEHAPHVRHDIRAADQDRSVASIAKRGV